MAASTYTAFTDRVIDKYEGPYTWDKDDPGGPTNMGITCYDLAEHRHATMSSMAAWAEAVKEMKRPEALAIYKQKYAAAISYDALPAGADTAIYDYEINSGIERVGLVVNSLLGLPGHVFNAATVKALQSTDVDRFITNLDKERLRFLHAIKGGAMWQKYGRGWGARVADVDQYSHHLASGKTSSPAPEAPDLAKVPTPKGVVVPRTGNAVTGGFVAGAGGGTAAVAAGAPHWVIGAIVGAAVVGAVGYGVYAGYQDMKANKVQL